MNFGKTEKPRFVSSILQIKPYTLYMWKWWGFPDFKKCVHTSPIRGPTFLFLIWFHHMICKNKSYFDGKVLQITKKVS